jgi:thiol-disulfide isomerase/thioredoxin
VTVHGRQRACLASIALFATATAPAATTREVALADGGAVPVAVHAAAPVRAPRLLWLPSGFNSQAAEAPSARRIAALGLEVWQTDLLSAQLLPPLESSLDQVPSADLVQLIDAAAHGDRPVYLLTAARAAVLALRGADAWRRAHPQGRALRGVILLHPNLYAAPPEPGTEGVYDAVVAQTRVPVFVLQPDLSPWRWRLDTLRAVLERAGAPVYTRPLPEVRDRFYFRPDATARERAATERLPRMIAQAVTQLARVERAAGPAPAIDAPPPAQASAPRARGLRPYQGDPTPPALDLVDLDGRRHRLRDYRGQVVVLNFWASWCPPCVHEMPSMQRLKDRFAARPLTILAANMGEDDAIVRAFLRTRVKVDFPIPMDRDGAALKRWKVFVFPTSFVLGPDGQIRYALYGELEWDGDEVAQIIESLWPRK